MSADDGFRPRVASRLRCRDGRELWAIARAWVRSGQCRAFRLAESACTLACVELPRFKLADLLPMPIYSPKVVMKKFLDQSHEQFSRAPLREVLESVDGLSLFAAAFWYILVSNFRPEVCARYREALFLCMACRYTTLFGSRLCSVDGRSPMLPHQLAEAVAGAVNYSFVLAFSPDASRLGPRFSALVHENIVMWVTGISPGAQSRGIDNSQVQSPPHTQGSSSPARHERIAPTNRERRRAHYERFLGGAVNGVGLSDVMLAERDGAMQGNNGDSNGDTGTLRPLLTRSQALAKERQHADVMGKSGENASHHHGVIDYDAIHIPDCSQETRASVDPLLRLKKTSGTDREAKRAVAASAAMSTRITARRRELLELDTTSTFIGGRTWHPEGATCRFEMGTTSVSPFLRVALQAVTSSGAVAALARGADDSMKTSASMCVGSHSGGGHDSAVRTRTSFMGAADAVAANPHYAQANEAIVMGTSRGTGRAPILGMQIVRTRTRLPECTCGVELSVCQKGGASGEAHAPLCSTCSFDATVRANGSATKHSTYLCCDACERVWCRRCTAGQGSSASSVHSDTSLNLHSRLPASLLDSLSPAITDEVFEPHPRNSRLRSRVTRVRLGISAVDGLKKGLQCPSSIQAEASAKDEGEMQNALRHAHDVNMAAAVSDSCSADEALREMLSAASRAEQAQGETSGQHANVDEPQQQFACDGSVSAASDRATMASSASTVNTRVAPQRVPRPYSATASATGDHRHMKEPTTRPSSATSRRARPLSATMLGSYLVTSNNSGKARQHQNITLDAREALPDLSAMFTQDWALPRPDSTSALNPRSQRTASNQESSLAAGMQRRTTAGGRLQFALQHSAKVSLTAAEQQPAAPRTSYKQLAAKVLDRVSAANDQLRQAAIRSREENIRFEQAVARATIGKLQAMAAASKSVDAARRSAETKAMGAVVEAMEATTQRGEPLDEIDAAKSALIAIRRHYSVLPLAMREVVLGFAIQQRKRLTGLISDFRIRNREGRAMWPSSLSDPYRTRAMDAAKAVYEAAQKGRDGLAAQGELPSRSLSSTSLSESPPAASDLAPVADDMVDVSCVKIDEFGNLLFDEVEYRAMEAASAKQPDSNVTGPTDGSCCRSSSSTTLLARRGSATTERIRRSSSVVAAALASAKPPASHQVRGQRCESEEGPSLSPDGVEALIDAHHDSCGDSSQAPRGHSPPEAGRLTELSAGAGGNSVLAEVYQAKLGVVKRDIGHGLARLGSMIRWADSGKSIGSSASEVHARIMTKKAVARRRV